MDGLLVVVEEDYIVTQPPLAVQVQHLLLVEDLQGIKDKVQEMHLMIHSLNQQKDHLDFKAPVVVEVEVELPTPVKQKLDHLDNLVLWLLDMNYHQVMQHLKLKQLVVLFLKLDLKLFTFSIIQDH
tara:strand:- start:149 stop:526 length:378 start_codon:yes stop_codon:yes gene_type:complete